MPYSRQTLSSIKTQISTFIQSSLPTTDPLLRFSNLGIIGRALANLINMCMGYLDWIARQAVPWTATDEFLYGWGALKSVYPKPGTSADNGAIVFSGTQGKTIPNGYPLVRGDGAKFTIIEGPYVIGVSGTATVSASADVAGEDGNSAAGTIMSLSQSIQGIQTTGVVSLAFSNGSEPETQSAFRSRMLEKYQNPPEGGAQQDYVTWALAVPGVTMSWCNPLGNGAGTVTVYTMWDDAESSFGGFPQGDDGVASNELRDTPATGDQLAVADYIYPLRPVTSLVYSVAPLQNTVNFTINGISTLPQETKDLIAASIAAVFLMFGSPVPESSGNSNGLTVELSYIEAAIIAVPGTEGFIITSPTTNITSSLGYLPVLGTITYT